MKKILYIVIEQKNRELDAKLLLALEAIKNDYIVLVGAKRLLHFLYLFPFPLGVYFYKDAMASVADKIGKIKRRGHKVVVHDEEGFVQFDWKTYLAGSYITENTLKFVDIFFCWGKEQLEVIKKLKKDKNLPYEAYSTGHPRLDILRAPVSKYSNTGQKFEKRMILINTKFGVGNYKDGVENYIKKQHHDYPDMTEENKGHFDRLAKYDVDLLDYYVVLIGKIVKKFKNDIIVIRPHPVENLDFWKEKYTHSPNVLVTKEGPIGQWVYKANVVLHTGCTTGIEAFLAGKPVVSYKPIENEEFDIELPNSVSFCVKTDLECINKLEQVLDQKYDREDYLKRGKEILAPHLDNIDEKYSVKPIIKEIDKLYEKQISGAIFHHLTYWIGFNIINLLLFIKSKQTGNLIRKDIIVHREVQETLESLSLLYDPNTTYKISPIVHDLMYITKK